MSFPVISFGEQIRDVQGTLTTDLNGGSLHLFTAVAPPLSPNSALADFTEAAYVGYAALVVATWSAGFRDLNGQGAVAMPSQNFVGPVAGGGPTILGCYYTASGVGTPLVWAAMFDQPFPLTDNLALLVVSAQISAALSGWVSTEGSVLP
jgi:hypothetical protein